MRVASTATLASIAAELEALVAGFKLDESEAAAANIVTPLAMEAVSHSRRASLQRGSKAA